MPFRQINSPITSIGPISNKSTQAGQCVVEQVIEPHNVPT